MCAVFSWVKCEESACFVSAFKKMRLFVCVHAYISCRYDLMCSNSEMLIPDAQTIMSSAYHIRLTGSVDRGMTAK